MSFQVQWAGNTPFRAPCENRPTKASAEDSIAGASDRLCSRTHPAQNWEGHAVSGQ